MQQYSVDLTQRVRTALTDYASLSQDLDRTFPSRLVRFVKDGASPPRESVILDQMKDLQKKRQRLIALGIVGSETSTLELLDEGEVQKVAEALTIYVQDVQKKLETFDDLQGRVGKFLDIVNARFQFKRLTIDRDEGFVFVSQDGTPISVNDLSSGEQHELVVLYELLFRSPVNGLVLVDEPELSLHVAWQTRFLPDLMQILELTNSYAVVATHSPIIIGDRWDLATTLDGKSSTDGTNGE